MEERWRRTMPDTLTMRYANCIDVQLFGLASRDHWLIRIFHR
jgi:hypothetical protein